MAASSSASTTPLSPFSFVYPEIKPETTPGQISGRLVHPNGDPFISKRINFDVWIPKMVFGKKVYESKITESVETNQDGCFSFSAKKISNIWFAGKNIRVTYDVFEKNVYHCPGTKTPEQVLVYSSKKENEDSKDAIKVRIDEQGNNLGNIFAEVYEYEKNSTSLHVPGDPNLRPQKWPYTKNLVFASASKVLKQIYYIANPFETTADVQSCFGAGDPSLKVSAETTIDMLLNGIFPCYFKKMEGGKLKLDINWDEYDKDIEPILPNASLILTKTTEGKLDIESVTLEVNGQKKTYLKDDPLFEHALYIFNCCAVVKGEVFSHLGTGHLWTEQVAMAAYRSLSNSPIAKLLLPHLKGVVEINRMGKSAIFGKEGILNVSGLTETGIRQALDHVLGAMDYATFKPRAPMEKENHPHAQAAQVIWSAFSDVVSKFVDENLPEIKKNWNEIFLLSKNLVENSKAHRPMDDEWNRNVWHDQNEIDDITVPGRVEHNGEIKAIRPITTSFVGPEERDIERLKQFVSYSIFIATYWHWSVHTSQKKWMTNLEIASLAPRQLPESKDWDKFAGLHPDDARNQLAIAKILTDFQTASLYENEFDDIHQGFLGALRDNLHKLEPIVPDILQMTPAVQI